MTPFDRPPVIEPLADPPGIVELSARLRAVDRPFVLESSLDVSGMGRWHLLGGDPVGGARVSGERWEWSVGEVVRSGTGDPWGALEEWWAAWCSAPHPASELQVELPFELPFLGGAVGYLGYELGERIENFPPREFPEDELPDLHLELYDELLLVRTDTGAAWWVHRGRDGEPERRWWQAPAPAVTAPRVPPLEEQSVSLVRDRYLASVDEIRESIAAGDVYEVNLTRRHCLSGGPSPWELHRRLRGVQPVPYAALLPWKPVAVVSASPERFLSRRGSHVDTRPIKGTAARGRDAAEDEARSAELLASEKERAELAMIVDLERNDLGKVCKAGSVVVEDEATVERYSTVLHTVATVRGTLPDDLAPFELIRAMFPGGSITGAPKIAAMQCIRHHEPLPRKVYAGSVGWIDAGGDLELSIAIRTVMITAEKTYFSVGGAVTWDSVPQDELAELEAKGKAVFAALRGDA